jgi:hypothetical protein
LLHFCEITQPFLPALNPQLNARFIEIGPTVSRSRERSDPDNDRSILHKSTTHSSGRYQNFLHNNQSTSALAAEIVLDIFATGTTFIVLSWFALRVLEGAGWEYGAVGKASAFMLTIGAMTNCHKYWLGIAFEFDGTAETRTFVRHLYGLENDNTPIGNVSREAFEDDRELRPLYLDHAVICTEFSHMQKLSSI